MVRGQQSGLVLGQMQRLFNRGTASGLSEGQLLARYVGERDEVAFEAIVSRNGPMVLGICRRLLEDPNDVEDAFQATFLVLVKKARSLRDRDLLANWLYGVALRVATRSRRDRTRRRIRDRTVDRDNVVFDTNDHDRDELRTVLDGEVARLPAKFRTPIVLCYLEGLTHDQAAERLRCPVGTIRSRMAKGRELLRSRLTRRGLAPTPSFLAIGPISGVSPAVPPALLGRTIASAASVVAGRWLVTDITSTSVMSLTQGVLRTMSLTKWITPASTIMVLGILGGGIGLAARQNGPESAAKQAEAESSQTPVNPARKALKDAQNGINEYEKQLKVAQAQIEQQHGEILALKERIQALEARAAGEGRTETTQLPGPTPKGQEQRIDPFNAAPGDVPLSPDIITTSPFGVIVSQSAKGDRVIIYSTDATDQGIGRAYRPPQGTKVVEARVWQHYVLIAANGPKAAQLAAYNVSRGKWATADLRGGINHSLFFFQMGGSNEDLLVTPSFQGSPLTQIAVFDSGRFGWFVQDLVEPWDEQGGTSPLVKGRVAAYVLGRHVYAYSAEAGRWDTLNLERPFVRTGIAGMGPEVTDNSVALSEGGRLHVFAAKTGRWQTIDPKD